MRLGLAESRESGVETWSTALYWSGVGWLLGHVCVVGLKVDVVMGSRNIS
jgi:hypothetical protein